MKANPHAVYNPIFMIRAKPTHLELNPNETVQRVVPPDRDPVVCDIRPHSELGDDDIAGITEDDKTPVRRRNPKDR